MATPKDSVARRIDEVALATAADAGVVMPVAELPKADDLAPFRREVNGGASAPCPLSSNQARPVLESPLTQKLGRPLCRQFVSETKQPLSQPDNSRGNFNAFTPSGPSMMLICVGRFCDCGWRPAAELVMATGDPVAGRRGDALLIMPAAIAALGNRPVEGIAAHGQQPAVLSCVSAIGVGGKMSPLGRPAVQSFRC